MSTNSYWQTVLQGRTNRRRVLAGLGASAAGTALLAACGGGDSATGPQDKSGLLARREDSSSRVQPGGTWPSSISSDAPGFDGLTQPTNRTAGENNLSYSPLLHFKLFNATKGEVNPTSDVEPEGAESFELSPDKLTLTFKLRPDLKLDPREPTNGRVLDASDVVYTWERFKESHRTRAEYANEINKAAPILSVSAPDSRTVVVKLAFPAAPLLPKFASFTFLLFPKERDGKYDAKATMRGSGPWMLTRYEPSVGFEYKKNPNYWRKTLPYLDGIERPIIPEYATGLAQFKAGRIADYAVTQDDILQTKQDVPSLRMLADDSFPFTGGGMVFYDFRPNSIWHDERLRQAVSLLVDRDLFIDTMANRAKFESVGLPFESRWHNHIQASINEYWLDPKGTEAGDTGKYFKYDPAEAKKLVQASGRTSVDCKWHRVAGTSYGLNYLKQAEILHGMIAATGDFKLVDTPQDYNTFFGPRVVFAHNFDDLAYSITLNPIEPDDFLSGYYGTGGQYYKFEPNYPQDQRMDALITQQRQEFDKEKRIALVKEVQKHLSSKMYTFLNPGVWKGFSLSQPWLGNVGTYVSASGTVAQLHYWLDQTKRN